MLQHARVRSAAALPVALARRETEQPSAHVIQRPSDTAYGSSAAGVRSIHGYELEDLGASSHRRAAARRRWLDCDRLAGRGRPQRAPQEPRPVQGAAAREVPEQESEASVANAAGQLLRFRHVMAPGDLIVYPRKADRTINIGRITGECAYDLSRSSRCPNGRDVI